MKLLLRPILLILICLTALDSYAQLTWRIVDVNQQAIQDKKLISKLKSYDSSERAAYFVQRYYAEKGYLNAKVELKSLYMLQIDQGCAFRIGNLGVQSGLPLNHDFLADYIGGTYSEKIIQDVQAKVLTDYEQEGYLSAELRIERFDSYPEACEVNLSLVVDEGEQWLIEDIQFSDTKRVGSNYLKKVAGVRDSLILTPQLLTDIQRKLQDTNYFERVDEPILVKQGAVNTLFIPLLERNPNYFDGIVGYVPNNTSNSSIVGELKLGLVNAINDGSELNLLFQRLTLENSRLNADFKQYWIGGLPLDAGASFRFFQQDTSYQFRTFELNGAYRVQSRIRITGRFESSGISATDVNTGDFNEVDGNRQMGIFGFEYSSLNHPRVPTEGLNFHVEFGRGRKRIRPEEGQLNVNRQSIAQNQIQIYSAAYFPLRSNQVLAFDAYGYLIDAQYFTEVDLKRFGGAKSFRGYTEEQFFASQVGWLNSEYRYLLNRDSFLFAFNTIGGFHRPALISETIDPRINSDFLYSFGFGLSYLTNVGQLTFSYAISPQDDISNGKVHFGIVTAL